MRFRKHEIEVLKDGTFVVPWIEHSPHVSRGDFGVPSGVNRAGGAEGIAFNYRPPLKTLDDSEFSRLHYREARWDSDEEEQERERLEEIFKGILSVRRRTGLATPLTSTAFDLVGDGGFMTLIYDNPEGLHRLMRLIKEDHLLYIRFMEKNGLLSLNNEADHVGGASMGCSKLLPAPDYKGKARAKDRWIGCESQESVSMSPQHYGEFVFPYLRELAETFGRVYYGCCEPVNPVWKYVSTIKTLQRVSISPWADEEKMGKYCRERKVVFSRKMPPQLLMADQFNENGEVRRSIERTVHCAAGARLEFILRDVYAVRNEPDRFRQWVELVREGGRAHKG